MPITVYADHIPAVYNGTTNPHKGMDTVADVACAVAVEKAMDG